MAIRFPLQLQGRVLRSNVHAHDSTFGPQEAQGVSDGRGWFLGAKDSYPSDKFLVYKFENHEYQSGKLSDTNWNSKKNILSRRIYYSSGNFFLGSFLSWEKTVIPRHGDSNPWAWPPNGALHCCLAGFYPNTWWKQKQWGFPNYDEVPCQTSGKCRYLQAWIQM